MGDEKKVKGMKGKAKVARTVAAVQLGVVGTTIENMWKGWSWFGC